MADFNSSLTGETSSSVVYRKQPEYERPDPSRSTTTRLRFLYLWDCALGRSEIQPFLENEISSHLQIWCLHKIMHKILSQSASGRDLYLPFISFEIRSFRSIRTIATPSQCQNKGGRATIKSSQEAKRVYVRQAFVFFYLGPFGALWPLRDREG